MLYTYHGKQILSVWHLYIHHTYRGYKEGEAFVYTVWGFLCISFKMFFKDEIWTPIIILLMK